MRHEDEGEAETVEVSGEDVVEVIVEGAVAVEVEVRFQYTCPCRKDIAIIGVYMGRPSC